MTRQGKSKPAPRRSRAADAGEDRLDTFGQITLPLDGVEYVLRPSFEAITAIETRLGRSLYELATDAARGSLMASEMAVIVVEMMHAQGKTLVGSAALDYTGATAETLGRRLFEAGLPATCARLMVVLSGALTGGYTAEGEAKAGTVTPPIPAGN